MEPTALANTAAETPRLYTFTLSHFSEKIRWTLSATQIPFVEQPMTPFFHILPAIFSGGKTTVPILQVGSRRVQDSTRILHWLDVHRGPLALLPRDEPSRAEVLAVEARFDRVGEHVVRYAYQHTLDDSESVIRYWTLASTPKEASTVRKRFPIFRWIFRRKLMMSAGAVRRSRSVIEEGLAFIEARVAAGHRYLGGDAFSVADITAAALLAPLVCPDEHPVYSSARYRKGVEADVAQWRERPAFEWVRSTYREHRGEFANAAKIQAALAD